MVGVYLRPAASVAAAGGAPLSDHRRRGAWDEIKGVIKEQKGKITDDRSTEASGKLDQAKGKLERKIGDAKGALRHEGDPKR